jgi:hypothetical protein
MTFMKRNKKANGNGGIGARGRTLSFAFAQLRPIADALRMFAEI